MVGRSSRVSGLGYVIGIWLMLAVACTSAGAEGQATPVAAASPPAQPCQRFEPLYPAALPGVFVGTGDWADYDSDGDVDLALTAGDIGGGPDLRIYRNDGGVWHLVFMPLRPLTGSDVAWGDYDNDGDLDLAFAGHELDRAVTIIYQNRGGEFRESGVGLPSVPYGSLAWGDADGDGDLDLLLTGADNEGGQTLLLINERGRFSTTATDLPALHSVYGASLAWNDYDGDLDQDLLFVGDSFQPQAIVRIYRNDGGSLVEVNAGLPPLRYATAAWADYDQDGDLDLALAGDADPNPGDVKLSPWAALFRNDNGFYVEAQQLAAIYGGALT